MQAFWRLKMLKFRGLLFKFRSFMRTKNDAFHLVIEIQTLVWLEKCSKRKQNIRWALKVPTVWVSWAILTAYRCSSFEVAAAGLNCTTRWKTVFTTLLLHVLPLSHVFLTTLSKEAWFGYVLDVSNQWKHRYETRYAWIVKLTIAHLFQILHRKC